MAFCLGSLTVSDTFLCCLLLARLSAATDNQRAALYTSMQVSIRNHNSRNVLAKFVASARGPVTLRIGNETVLLFIL